MIRTLFGKLLIALLGFGAMMIAIFAVIIQWSHGTYHLELDQRAASDLASRIVAQGLGVDGADDAAGALDGELQRIAKVNSGVDLYVLDEQGKVVASSLVPSRLKRDRVDMAPLRRYLGGDADPPILGADPSDAARNDVFSIASISVDSQGGKYLYALLHRREHQEGAGLIKVSYLLGDGAWLVAAGSFLAFFSSVAIGRLLTRRLRQLTAEIEKFRLSGFTEPPDGSRDPPDRPNDEVGRLDEAFSEMAGLIVRQMRELKRTDAMRRELLASVSHDLRAPLAAVQKRLETLTRKETQLTADDRLEYLEIATRQTSRMAKLVSKLFDLARLDARQMPFDPQPFVMPDVVREVIQKHSLAAANMGVDLRADVPQYLPLAVADMVLVERVLDNLVENALRYTGRGGNVCIRLAQTAKGIAVEVSDTGAGIAPEPLATIFDRFVPTDESRPGAPDGAGRGLAIVKSILDLHGSEIRAVSAVGAGTTFQFDIPARKAALPDRAVLELELTGPIRIGPRSSPEGSRSRPGIAARPRDPR